MPDFRDYLTAREVCEGMLTQINVLPCACPIFCREKFADPLRYINCRNANWILIQLCRSVLRAVFDVFHFVSASLVHGVKFCFVLHEKSQKKGENIAKKPTTFKNISGAFPHRINPPNLVCTSVQAVPLRISGWFFYFQPGFRGTGVQLCLQHSNSRNQKPTSPSHYCGEQNRSKPS